MPTKCIKNYKVLYTELSCLVGCSEIFCFSMRNRISIILANLWASTLIEINTIFSLKFFKVGNYESFSATEVFHLIACIQTPLLLYYLKISILSH